LVTLDRTLSGGTEPISDNLDGRYISKYTVPVPENSGSTVKVYKLGKRVVRKVPVNLK